MQPVEPQTDDPPAEAGPAKSERWIKLPYYEPRLAWAILAVNVVIYFITRQAMGPNEDFSDTLFRFGAKYGPAIDAGEYWRLFAPIFLHGSAVHLAVNSYALYILGPTCERIFGWLRFAAIYLLAGLAGSVASYAFNPEALS